MPTAPRPARRPVRRRHHAVAVLAAAGTAAATLMSAGPAAATSGPAGPAAAPGAQAPAGGWKTGSYVVTLVAAPAATYTGGVSGLAATRPARGERLDVRDPDVVRYRDHLTRQQDGLLRRAGVTARYRYTVAVNGFAARLTAKQAATLAGSPGVLAVSPDEARSLDTTETPALLGLSGRGGVWEKLGGRGDAGTGVVVGVIDSGVTPESPSFAGRKVTRTKPGDVGVPYRTASGAIALKKARGGTFVGACQTGEEFPASTCNSTLVSARWFGEGFLANVPAEDRSEFEFISPRDGDGHGTHTASTAVGRPVRDVTVGGSNLGTAVGMAPAAKLAVYKVCWEDNDPNTGGCYTSDSVKAIDQAVADGVDVINYSISGALNTVIDPVELAFLSAASAGVFVSASAGNSGPGASTVAHNSPWVTTVAATTAHRFEGTVRLGDGTLLKGASINRTALPATAAVLSDTIAAAGVPTTDAGLCAPGSLDPAGAAGKVVVCDRGVYDRVAKSAEVERAGGVGMVLTNVTPGSLDADLHAVPTVHVDEAARATVRAYVSGTASPTVALLVGDTTGGAPTPIPVVAGFSSRGPALANGGDVLKPDVAAPGVSIVAAVAPGPAGGETYGLLSGTSMSAPHVAGLAALVFQAHPSWSPMAVKSAMMTTATDTRTASGGTATDPFAQGAGFVQPKRFLSPGLVYDSTPTDWLEFVEGLGVDTGTGVEAVDPSDLNQASVAVGALAGAQTVTRSVTATRAGLYRATAAVPGVDVTVSPSILSFGAAGETKSFKVTLRRTSAELNRYATGFLTWTGGGTTVRSPLAVRPVLVAAPAEVHGEGTSGSATYSVTPGQVPIALRAVGLTPGDVTADTVAAGGGPNPAGDAANKVYPVDVPAGTTLARFDLVAGNASDDLDLFLYDGTGRLVAQSATGSASERIDRLAPAAGRYTVVVNGFSTVGDTAAYDLRTFTVGAAAEGNLTVSPASLTGPAGEPADVTVSWSGLEAGTPYLGWVGYGDGAAAPTVVSVG